MVHALRFTSEVTFNLIPTFIALIAASLDGY